MTFLTDLAEFGSAIAGIINGTKAKKWGRYRSWLLQEQPGIISEFFFFLSWTSICYFAGRICGREESVCGCRFLPEPLCGNTAYDYCPVLLRDCFCAGSCDFMCSGSLLIFSFKITKEKVEKYQAEIDARA